MCSKPAGESINSVNLILEYTLNLFICSLEAEYLRAKIDSAQILNNETF